MLIVRLATGRRAGVSFDVIRPKTNTSVHGTVGVDSELVRDFAVAKAFRRPWRRRDDWRVQRRCGRRQQWRVDAKLPCSHQVGACVVRCARHTVHNRFLVLPPRFVSPWQKRALGIRLKPRRIVPLRVRARPWPFLAVHQRHNQPVPLFRRISHLLYQSSFNRSRIPASVYKPAKDRCKVGRRAEASSYPARLLPPPLYSPSKSLGGRRQIDASRQPSHKTNNDVHTSNSSNRRRRPPQTASQI